MKKTNLLIIALGGAAGLLCALEISRRNRRTGNRVSDSASTGKIQDGKPTAVDSQPEHLIDDRGTDQETASEILKQVRDSAFDSSNEKLSLALGRPPEDIERVIEGQSVIDGDVLMKARALAIQRGIETE